MPARNGPVETIQPASPSSSLHPASDSRNVLPSSGNTVIPRVPRRDTRGAHDAPAPNFSASGTPPLGADTDNDEAGLTSRWGAVASRQDENSTTAPAVTQRVMDDMSGIRIPLPPP